MNAREPPRQPMTWPSEIGLDELFDAVSNPRRRFVLDQVNDLDEFERVSAGRLAEGRAFMETDVETIEAVRSQDRRTVYNTLIQAHLPKLHEIGLVDYDDRAKTVGRTPATRYAIETIRFAVRKRNGVGPSRTNGARPR